MGEIFDEHKADLSGLLETSEQLHVSEVIHKAYIHINEAGTEAAGATSGEIFLFSYLIYIRNK